METKIAILRTQENQTEVNAFFNKHCKDGWAYPYTTGLKILFHYPAIVDRCYTHHDIQPGYTLISSLPEFIEEWEKAYGQKQPCTCRNHVYAENCNINYGHGEEPDRKSELLSLYREYMELSDGFLKMVTHFNASDEMKDKFTSLRTRIAEIEKQQTI